MRHRRDEHLKYEALEKKRNYSRTPGGCTTLSKSSIDVFGQIRRIIFRTSSLALSIDPFPAKKKKKRNKLFETNKKAGFYVHNLQKNFLRFQSWTKQVSKNYPSKCLQKSIKPLSSFKALSFLYEATSC